LKCELKQGDQYGAIEPRRLLDGDLLDEVAEVAARSDGGHDRLALWPFASFGSPGGVTSQMPDSDFSARLHLPLTQIARSHAPYAMTAPAWTPSGVDTPTIRGFVAATEGPGRTAAPHTARIAVKRG